MCYWRIHQSILGSTNHDHLFLPFVLCNVATLVVTEQLCRVGSGGFLCSSGCAGVRCVLCFGGGERRRADKGRAYGVVPVYLSEISPVAFRAMWPGVGRSFTLTCKVSTNLGSISSRQHGQLSRRTNRSDSRRADQRCAWETGLWQSLSYRHRSVFISSSYVMVPVFC